MILRKDQLEASLHEEKKLIENGRLKEDSPLDLSASFSKLCEACRRGDLKVCQEMITTEGVNINARDQFDYTPLILVSALQQRGWRVGTEEKRPVFVDITKWLLLESGALCERDTFQGERCLYNALNDRIRNLLLSYDYSKSSDPLQPFAAHITSLLAREHPQTSDILVTSADRAFNLHKFILSARSPYFRKKLGNAPDTTNWKLPPTIPPQAFDIAIRYVYLGEIPNDVGGGPGTGFTEEEVLEGIEKISKYLEIPSLWEGILESSDRRLARQNRTEEVERGRNQVEAWFRDNVMKHKIVIESSIANSIQWDRDNAIFADVLLRADESANEDTPLPSGIATPLNSSNPSEYRSSGIPLGIPVGPLSQPSSISNSAANRQSTLYPAHRAMLLRSEYFLTMFSSSFLEAQPTPHLLIVPIDCSPAVLEIILTYLYTENATIPLSLAVDVLIASDLLLIEKLKVKAAVVISTLGNGSMPQHAAVANLNNDESATFGNGDDDTDEIDIYDVLRAGWLTRVPRLETFAARFLAYRLEAYIDDEEFTELIRESAARIKARQETDSIELVDDIRFYLSERFRLRFEDAGIEEMMDEEEEAGMANDESSGVAGEVKDGQEARRLSEKDEFRDAKFIVPDMEAQMASGAVRTLDGEIAGDEFAGDAINYQILLGKIDALLERLKLDA
ncbi:hypothetical protein MMC17_008024 [Xylographa soralifera]|nr:hypothetical protein [Xylographa soralifera]